MNKCSVALVGILGLILSVLGVGPVTAAPDDSPSEVAALALVDPSTRTGLSADVAAASCWEIIQLHPGSPDGAYWLLTPEMTAPERFWCDMTTDGGGWVRIAVGRHSWDAAYLGKGNPSAMLTADPAPSTMVQLPSPTIDDLLNGGRVMDLPDTIRLRRAMDIGGTTWQEVRFGIRNRDRWVWTMGAEHQVNTYSFDGVTGSGGGTSNFGADNAYRRVTTSISSNQSYTWGFAYGSLVTGTSSSDTYLWSRAAGVGAARPYTEIYLRPMLMSEDLHFTAVPDGGTEPIENVSVAESTAQASPWGVNGLAGSTSGEGQVEVQAFEQIGSVMYVGGNFRYVQQDASGAGRVEQSFLAAFDARTGAYLPSFSPDLNEAVRTLAALPNGNLAVGGRFTQVNGQGVQGLVALDPGSGDTVPGWGPRIENNLSVGTVDVRSIAVKDDYLYLGGAFTHLTRPDGSGRVYARAAGRVAVSNGWPNAWNPEFNGTVVDLDPAEDGDRVYFAGFFSASRGATAISAAAVMVETGQLDPTPWTPTWSAGANYQQGIDQVGDKVWVGGSEHSLFQFSTSTYQRLMGNITKQHGDFQAVSSGFGQLYAGCHCNHFNYTNAYTWPSVGSSWTQADAIGWLAAWDADDGDVTPHFVPDLQMRLGSGIWAIKVAEDGTVWAGGDITQGRTTAGYRWLGGMARFPAADASAPAAPSNLRATTQTETTVRLAWDAASGGFSRYQVLRDDRVIATTASTAITVPKAGANRFFVRAEDSAGNVSASTPVFATGDGNPAPVPVIEKTVNGLQVSLDASSSTDDSAVVSYLWDLGDGTTSDQMSVTHDYATSGIYTVWLTVVDDGGTYRSVSETLDLSIPEPTDAYGAGIHDDEPYLYWRLNEGSGSFAQDYSGNDRAGEYFGGVTRGQQGALASNNDPAAGFDGVDGHVVAREAVTDPGAYSLEVWFQSTTDRGGKLIGFGRAPSGLSSSYDRHVWLENDGRLSFGAWTGTQNTATTTGSYTDGEWHHVVATQGSDGMKLYVDGVLRATNPQTDNENYTGYWRIGGDNVWSGSSRFVNATLDEAAVYESVLTAEQVATHHALGTAQLPNQLPTADFIVAENGLSVAVDASVSADSDGVIESYEWSFGDGGTATGESTTHSYLVSGTYTVELTVTDNDGGASTKTIDVTVEAPNQLPTAAFTAATSGAEVQVDASSSSDPDGTIASYTWDFGDGSSGDGVTASHLYAGPGTYEVTLTVTDDRSGSSTHTEQVNVAEGSEPVTATVVARDASWEWYYGAAAPAVDWAAVDGDRSGWQVGGAPLGWGFAAVQTDIDIDGPTSDRPRVAYFATDFEVSDPSKVVQLELDTVANDGVVVYVNGVEVGRHNMRDGTVSHLTYAASSRRVDAANADPLVVQVPTDLLVAGTNVVAASTHLGYRSTPDVSFELDAELTVLQSGPVNQSPAAQFQGSVDGLTISVDASGSSDPEGGLSSYEWDFGDGATASGVTAGHTYAGSGVYTVTLTVADAAGLTDEASQVVTVSDGAEPVAATVVARDASWEWYYGAAAPAVDWAAVDGDRSGWQVGGAPLGWGFAAVQTDIDIDGPTSDRPRVAYFATDFEVSDPSKVVQLELDTVANDGVVVYVNGVEVGRHNMRDGTVSHLTYAASSRRVDAANADPLVVQVPTDLLVAGTNVVAASTHLGYRSTPDVSFELEAELTSF
ncbi:PKD domain-containing protein [Ornithinimicrobium cavernae]|uniref:PKD domain-containing protein n=1 Tax=Ornithinimicrobium cavernae TaxID=2666047 RepID=UPI000D689A25|nr:PKD domain-containing protein [Ornithinimicrobium cavernae]